MDNFTVEELTDNHYRSVKGIFRNTFDRDHFTINDLNICWKDRSKPNSIGLFLNNNLIAFVISSFHTENGPNNMYIDYIAVDNKYRGLGIGTFILEGMVDRARRNRSSIHLYPERPALFDWYERIGFSETYGRYYNFHSYETRSRS